MEIGDLQLSNEKLKKYCDELKKTISPNREVLFIKGLQLNLNSFEIDVARNRCYYAYPPTGLQYLAAAINERHLKVKILDLNFEFLKKIGGENHFDYHEWIDLLDEYFEKNNPSIIGVSNLFSIDTPSFIEILEHLKKRKDSRIIIAGGQNATYEGEKLLEDNLCHFVCQRESENKINFLFDNLYENLSHEPTPGILFRYNGKIEETEGKRDIIELKGNLKSAHKLVPIEKYCEVGTLSPYSRMAGKDTPFATILFNRGCEGRCKFCGVVDYMGSGVRSRRIEDCLDEVEYLNKERGIKHFEFLDDDFARYKDRAKAVLQGIINRKLEITWASNNGLIAKTIDRELMEKMRDSNCLGFKIGVESGNAEVLKKIKKPGTLKNFTEFSKISQNFPEMFIVDNYIFGFPDECFGQMIDSYNFSIEMNLDWSNYAIYQHNVSYFGNEEERKKGGNRIGDFIPTKDYLKGKIDSYEKILNGLNVFKIQYDTTPSREQLKSIWSVFNLGRNFIQNKNLNPAGIPKKFIRWVSVVEERYPTHPYINLFLSLAYNLEGDEKNAETQCNKMHNNLHEGYWMEKFNQFEFNEIIKNFPKNHRQSEEAIDFLRKKYTAPKKNG